MIEPQEIFMRRAIELSEQAGLKEQTGGVFGAVIVKDGKIIGEGRNQVIKNNDPTWHAEMEAIKMACHNLSSPHLEGAVLYTSAEPCPMCYAAACWAHLAHIFFGARVEDAKKYGGFEDIDFYAEIRKDPKGRVLKSSEFLREPAVEIWKQFGAKPDHVRY